jgi:hypothetical protein
LGTTFRGTVARILAAGAVAGFALAAPQAASAGPAEEGSWGPLQTYPVVPVSMGVMPDGKIVAWDQANKPPNFGSIPNNGPAIVLDPATGQVTRSTNIAPRTTFCSLITSLPDGRLAVIGGGSDSGGGATRDVQVFDGSSKTFSVLGQMNSTRWYPGGTLDRDGNMVVAGGTSRGIEEVNQATGVSTTLDTSFVTNWYPDLLRMQNGNFLVEDVGDNATAGSGRYLLSGNNLSSFSDRTLLQTRRRGIRTMIGPYTMFYNSGGTSRNSMIIDASSGTPRFSAAASSRLPHMTGQAVTLPTGQVLAVGGNSSGHDTKGTPVMTPELYSPDTNSWADMAVMAKRRTYHSVAALLPDGRVWSAGSSFDEVQEPNGQFFSPPYLYSSNGQPAPRPTATGAPATVTAGQTFSVATNTPGDIAYASYIRLAATTHQLNAGQAFVKLPVTASGGRVEMRAPTVDEAPPGYYMVFLVNRNGVPSVAPVVRMEPSSSTPLQPRVVQSSQQAVATPASNAFDGNPAQGSTAKFAQTLTESQPWWEVDLGESQDLDAVTLRLRSDCCTNRDLWVFASDEPFTSTTVDGLRAQSGVAEVRVQTPSGSVGTATINDTARYLRVQSPASSGQLTLAEVELVRNQRPSVSVTSPANGSQFTAPASYTFSANASDADGQVTKVEFFRGSNLVGTDTNSPYSVNESNVPAGDYNLTAKATDSAGDSTTSAPVAISVKANQAPTVSVTSPANGAVFTAPASFAFSANAADSDGQVAKVEFFRGSDLVGTDTVAPFTVNQSGLGAGTYALTAKATDNAGATTTSGTVSITVENPAPTGPIAAYAFDEGTGATLTDRSGNGHNGTISGATWTQGKSGRALSFDGGTNMVTVPDHNALDLGDAFTIESWIRPRSLDNWRMAVIKEAPPNTLAYGLYASAGDGKPNAWTAGGAAWSPQAVPLNAWSHVATTYDRGTMRIYIDGQLVATETGIPTPPNTSGPLRIGGNAIWDFETFDGLIDDVRIYGRALSESEVRADRDTPVAPPPPDDPPPPTGPEPTLELTFDEGAGTVATDTSGKGHNGTISGATWTNTAHSGGKALAFDGVDDRVTVADHADLDLGQTFTIESWIRPRSLEGWRMAVIKEAPPNTLSYGLYASAGDGAIPNAWTAGGAVVSPQTVPVGTWTHLATTYDRGTMRIYINGQLVATQTGVSAPPNTSGPLRIGGNAIWGFETFDGQIDDVRIYREVVTPDQFAGGDALAGGAVGKRLARKCVAKGKWKKQGKVKKATCKKKKKKKGRGR